MNEIKNKYTEIIKRALLIRLVEEKLLSLFKIGKINGTVHTCIGQEFIGVCIANALNKNDYTISNHRGHGHLLSRNDDIKGFFAELMGKKDGMCGGIGGSQHLYLPNHLSNGIQGGMTPVATGIALANKFINNNRIVVCYIGDGTLGEGVLYESLNISSIWDLPILFVLENNQFAQSTSIKQTFAGRVEERIRGFGIEYYKSNIWDIEHLIDTTGMVVGNVRKNKSPYFLEIESYRLHAHSKGDDNRNANEIKKYKENDILNNIIQQNDQTIENIIKQHNDRITNIINEVEKMPDIESIERKTTGLQRFSYKKIDGSPNNKRINELIYEALKTEFKNNPNTMMIGEDIEYATPYTSKPYGGAFKVTRNLSKEFVNRVRNTPISEAAITGIGSGLALGGIRSIVEIMFGDFMTLTFDQILNHACKFPKMYGRQVPMPLVIRTPMGGKRGYGPTHSQSIEKHFLGIPDLKIIALNQRTSPEELFKSVFSEDIPILVIENKILYTRSLQPLPPAGFSVYSTDERYPTIKISPSNNSPDITIVCYGGILEDIEQAIGLAFDEEEILCEVVCPSLIHPINISPVIESVQKTNSLLTVEEGPSVAALSSEIAALLLENNMPLKSFKRIAYNDIIPSSFKAEKNLLPNANSIFQKIKETYYGK